VAHLWEAGARSNVCPLPQPQPRLTAGGMQHPLAAQLSKRSLPGAGTAVPRRVAGA
jgi:hypothetical protein